MPSPADERAAAAADLAACRRLLRGGSKSFHAASLLLPRRVRGPATALYAFCRLADDAVDEAAGGGAGRAAGLARLHDRLDRAYAGRPLPIPADRAFARVVAAYAVPRALPEALFEGFAWDAEARRYPDLAAVEAYAARVAGSVGAMMALLMGARSAAAVARAADLGTAMQLSNIARDVGEDARAGRLYLPQDWMRAAGLEPEAFLARPAFTPALGAVVGRLLRHADALYARAEGGIALLPAGCRPGIAAARIIYAEIGREVERRGLDSVGGRAAVRGRRKLWLLARGVGAAATLRPARAPAPPLDANRFLVAAAVAAAPAPAAAAAGPAGLRGRAVWVLDLFERLERQERLRRAAVPGLRLAAAATPVQEAGA